MPDKFGDCVDCHGRYLANGPCPGCGSDRGWQNIGAASLGSVKPGASSPETSILDKPPLTSQSSIPSSKTSKRPSK